MTLKTPTLHATGVYTLTTPWATAANTIYTCIAIRSFKDLILHGVDIAATYYDPMGLDATNYQADLSLGANLITLTSPNQPTLYVPDTYIEAYPDLTNVAYNNIVLSCLLGPLPDGLDLTFLTSQISGVVSDVIGLEPTVNIYVSPSTGVMTTDQAEAAETARQANITNRTTDRAKVLTLQAQLDAANQLIATLQNLAITNGWITPTPSPAPAADGTAASFTSTPTNLQVAFADASTPATGVTITAWAWNFGDSAGTATTQNPSYTYAQSGTYLVELDVTDSNGQVAKVWKQVTVASATPAPAPTPTPTPAPAPTP